VSLRCKRHCDLHHVRSSALVLLLVRTHVAHPVIRPPLSSIIHLIEYKVSSYQLLDGCPCLPPYRAQLRCSSTTREGMFGPSRLKVYLEVERATQPTARCSRAQCVACESSPSTIGAHLLVMLLSQLSQLWPAHTPRCQSAP
jgi:hypothetical protein